MPRSTTIECLPRAFRMMEGMQAHCVEWSEGYRRAAGAALKEVLEGPLPGRARPLQVSTLVQVCRHAAKTVTEKIERFRPWAE